MDKLQADEYFSARSVLRPLDIHLAVTALLEGSSPGEIYVDDRKEPRSAFLGTMGRYFLSGASNNAEFNLAVKSRFDEQIFPEAQDGKKDSFTLYFAPDGWGKVIKDVILKGKHPVEHRRHYYRFIKFMHDWREVLPEGFSVLAVDSSLLEGHTLENLNDLKEEMQSERPSVEAFLEKSFGYCVRHEDQLVAWCLSEYNCGVCCEVGIETQEDYRQQGFGIITTSALVERALIEGISKIGWHCYAGNEASIATALTVGFKKVCEYPTYWVMFKEAISLAVNGNVCFEHQDYREAVDWYEKAIEAGEVPVWVTWNTACAYAHLDQKEKTFNYLNLAVEQGFRDLEFIKTSPHFKKWHASEDWSSLLSRLEAE
jgi:RimJ/RimL family protein N-acetyltransferase